MTKLVDLVAEAKAKHDLNIFQDAIPYARFLGMSVEASNGELTGKLPFSDRIIGNPTLPALHGGAVGAFLETTAILQVMWQLEAARVPKTITITVDYLRSAGPKDTFAKATVTKLGGRVANVRAYAWQDSEDKPVASINANFMVSAPE